MKNFDITIAANGTQHIYAPGQYFRYYSGQASGLDEAILLTVGNGGVVCILKPGQSIRVPFGVTDWLISNYENEAAITGIVVIGDGEIKDSSIVGVVSVMDGGLKRTMLNEAFLGTIARSPLAGNYAHTQLWNPVGSTKIILVVAVSFSSTSDITAQLAFDSNPRAYLGAAPVSKRAGGIVGQGLLRSESNVLEQYSGSVFLSYMVLAGASPLTINFKEPLALPEGSGLNVISGSMGTNLFANFEYIEQ